MSKYRTVERAVQSDVHQGATNVNVPRRNERLVTEILPAIDWSVLRRAKPVEVVLPLTGLWIDNLPDEARPDALVEAFPRIANTLALLSPDHEALCDYVGELLFDRRGNRRGFPVEILLELYRLRDYFGALVPELV